VLPRGLSRLLSRPDALDGQRHLRPHEQCRPLFAVRHGGERLADRTGCARHPWRRPDRPRGRDRLPLFRRDGVSRHGDGGPARGAAGLVLGALRGRPVPQRRRRGSGRRLLRPCLCRARDAAAEGVECEAAQGAGDDPFMSDETGDRLTALEIRYAEQERTIAELSDQLAGQWKTIDRMQKKLEALTERFLALEESAAPEIPVTKPPHW